MLVVMSLKMRVMMTVVALMVNNHGADALLLCIYSCYHPFSDSLNYLGPCSSL